jgi:hypothetical protein
MRSEADRRAARERGAAAGLVECFGRLPSPRPGGDHRRIDAAVRAAQAADDLERFVVDAWRAGDPFTTQACLAVAQLRGELLPVAKRLAAEGGPDFSATSMGRGRP